VSTAGAFVTEFEHRVADITGTRYAVATASGTAALHIALLVAGVEADDEVLVPALTFIAPANAVRYCNAWPVFVDVEAEYWQMDPNRVADFLRGECRWRDGRLVNLATGRSVRALLPVDLLGHPVDADPLRELAREFGLIVVEDATESLGATYKGRAVGSLGDVACFSFNGNKIVTTGGGGMIVTDNAAWAERARYLTTQAKDEPVEYVHKEVGFNYRLTNVQAALGCAQLERLPGFVEAKRRSARLYQDFLAPLAGVTSFREAEWAHGTYWLFAAIFDEAKCGISSRAVMHALKEHGVEARPLWQPLHRSPAHSASNPTACPVADCIQARALCLPSSVNLTDDQRTRVLETVAGITGTANVSI
jgi:perosamine synthetase